MNNFLAYLGIGVFSLHILVIYQVWRSDAYTPRQKLLQGVVVVLLPFLGAILVLLLAASRRMNPPLKGSEVAASEQTSYNQAETNLNR